MNFVKNLRNFIFVSQNHALSDTILATLLCVCLVGCGDRVQLPSSAQLHEFEMAGPSGPSVDMDRLIKAKIGGGEYHIVPGDVLELSMPVILQVVTAEGGGRYEQFTPYVCRVHETGAITLPIIDQIEVAGKTLSQVETNVINAYHPKYVTTRPTVFARILEYKTATVSITGAVQKPGIYSLRNDQMSLVALLMEAEGIVEDGASVIKINHRDKDASISKKAVPTLLDINRTREIKFTSHYPGSKDEVKVQLSFQQDKPLSTIGLLTIKQDEKRIFSDHVDLADIDERMLLLGKLSFVEPLVSLIDIDQKLCELQYSLKADFGEYDSEYKAADSNIQLGSLLTANSALQENLSGAESRISNTSLEEKLSPQAKRKLSKYRQSHIREEIPKTERIANQDTIKKPETIILPIKGLNIPFVDVVLQDGDSVIVEKLEPSLVTVMGLVNRPGNFPYPPDARYNLVQALAFAGGLNEVADPRYVTVHRLKPDGTIVRAVFPIKDGSRLTDAANTLIKPGDIVDVEHTPRTRTAVFLDRIFRINIGTYLRLEDAWE